MEKIYLFTLVISFVVNYMTFLETIITMPIIHFVSFYYQLQVQLEGSYNNYTGKKLEGADRDHYFSIYLNAQTGLIILFCVHTWFVQKDLITVAIKNHMIKRQQT